jgi:hypothetical protein
MAVVPFVRPEPRPNEVGFVFEKVSLRELGSGSGFDREAWPGEARSWRNAIEQGAVAPGPYVCAFAENLESHEVSNGIVDYLDALLPGVRERGIMLDLLPLHPPLRSEEWLFFANEGRSMRVRSEEVLVLTKAGARVGL